MPEVERVNYGKRLNVSMFASLPLVYSSILAFFSPYLPYPTLCIYCKYKVPNILRLVYY